MLNNKQKAVIHVAKSKVGMTDDEYRAMLSSVGVVASNYLDDKSFQIIMRHFEKLGFKSNYTAQRPKTSRTRLLGKIEAIKSSMILTDVYINAIAQRMFKVDSYKWLDAGQLHKLTAAMTYYQRRAAVK
jgi:phage gp16-like protein